MGKFLKEELALNEVRLLYQKYDSDANQLDSKAANLLSSSSLILTLFGVLQIPLLKLSQPLCYKILVIITLIAFFGVVITTITTLKPRVYKTSFEADWEGVENAILKKEDEQSAYKQLIGNYLDRIKNNSEINKSRALTLMYSSCLFILMMGSLLLSSFVAAR